ncbi:hypothetical protein AB6A40_011602 [Gnathostoma spinigerum]|uniref:Uncharacterized protein n=1 Tax=Gnathostoma spinigerum TaxID=75299 RepID=A0ABD6EY45_9BILA
MTSLIGYLLGPTSPIFMILLFTSVPALLASKFVSAFDLLMGGMDVMIHFDYATEFLTSSLLINRMIGYGILSASLVFHGVLFSIQQATGILVRHFGR